MAVRIINAAIKRLDRALVKAELLRAEDSEGTPVQVCTASLEDWNRFVRSERQALKSRWMAWRDGSIFIVEYPGDIHERTCYDLSVAFSIAAGTGPEHLIGHNAAYVEELPAAVVHAGYLEPDFSSGPSDEIGAILPAGLMDWSGYHTLKAEIGVSRGWNELERKANLWRQYPGVQYILSIRLSPALYTREYRLDLVENGEFVVPRMARTRVDANAVLRFKAHRLLGLPPGAPLPHGFHDPVVVNLF